MANNQNHQHYCFGILGMLLRLLLFIICNLGVAEATTSPFLHSKSRNSAHAPLCGMQTPGTLIIDGGEFDRSRRSATSQAIIQHLPGIMTPEDAKLVLIVAGGSQLEDDEREEFTNLWTGDLGFDSKSFTILHPEQVDYEYTGVEDAEESDKQSFVQPLETADAVFMSGGRQWRLVDAFKYTRTHEEMWDLLERGGTIAGTSAGATSQGFFMPRGDPDGSSVMVADREWYRYGFGFLPGVALDVHVDSRDRWEDLYEVLRDEDSSLLGIGISEKAAIVVQGNFFQVIGEDKGKPLVAVYSCSDKEECNEYDSPYVMMEPGEWFDLCKRDVVSEPSPESLFLEGARSMQLPYLFERDYRLAGREFRCSGRFCRWISSAISTAGHMYLHITAELISDGDLEYDDYIQISYRFGRDGDWINIDKLSGGVNTYIDANITISPGSDLQIQIESETSDEGDESFVVRGLMVSGPDTSMPAESPSVNPSSSPMAISDDGLPNSFDSGRTSANALSSSTLSYFIELSPFHVQMAFDGVLSSNQISQSSDEIQIALGDYLLVKLADDSYGRGVELVQFNISASLLDTLTVINNHGQNLFNREGSHTAYLFGVQGGARFDVENTDSVDLMKLSRLLDAGVSELFSSSENQAEFADFISSHESSAISQNVSSVVVTVAPPATAKSHLNQRVLILGVVAAIVVLLASVVLISRRLRSRREGRQQTAGLKISASRTAADAEIPMQRTESFSDDSLFKFSSVGSEREDKCEAGSLSKERSGRSSRKSREPTAYGWDLLSELNVPDDEIVSGNGLRDADQMQGRILDHHGVKGPYTRVSTSANPEAITSGKSNVVEKVTDSNFPRHGVVPKVILVATPKVDEDAQLLQDSKVLRVVDYDPPRSRRPILEATDTTPTYTDGQQPTIRRSASYNPQSKHDSIALGRKNSLVEDCRTANEDVEPLQVLATNSTPPRVTSSQASDIDIGDTNPLISSSPSLLGGTGYLADAEEESPLAIAAGQEESDLTEYEKKRVKLRIKEAALREKLAEAYQRCNQEMPSGGKQGMTRFR